MAEKDDRSGSIDSPMAIMGIASGMQRARVLLSAYDLEIWTALGEESLTSEEVAARLNTDARATDRLMNALCSLGLLLKEDGRFSNTPASARYLVRGGAAYMSGLQHYVNLWDSWSTLTQAVRAGKSVCAGHINDRGDKWLIAFIEAMHWMGRENAPKTVELLDLEGVSRVLDVGGGSAAYSMAFVQAGEGITATVFDLPNVLPLTRKYIEQEGLSDKITTKTGDCITDDLGSGYDIVFCSSLAHSNSVEENRQLLRKAAAALNPGGRVVVREFIVDEDRTGPPFAVMFALNMLVGTQAGDAYTESEIRSWFEEAGLENIERIDEETNASMIVGRKPEA